MKKRDIFVIIIMILISVITYFIFVKDNNQVGTKVVVMINNVEDKVFDINDSIEYKINTEYGYNILKIENGYADVIESNCPDKNCVNQKRINKNNEKIICLPNKVIIEVKGGEENNIDSIAN